MSRVLQRTVSARPEMAVRGKGLVLTLADGREVLDATGGAAVACLGHGNQRVAAAIADQAGRMAYAHTGMFTSQPAEELAEMLLGGEPGGLSHAFFVSSGSEAVESALKLARQYFIEVGQPQRVKFISRRQSYHGNTLGSLAAGGNTGRRVPYEPMFGSVFSRVSPCFAYHYQEPHETDAQYVARLAAELDAEFERLGPETVAAFCAEPVVGATAGCVVAVPGYFRVMREICNKHGALLILDEIMCGMGRTGTTHAWEQEGVVPDIETIGKALGGGYQAISAVLMARFIVDAIGAGSGAFVHGHTFQAHAIACRGAIEVQTIIREEGLLQAGKERGAQLQQSLKKRVGGHEFVGDIRGRGLFQAIEFTADRETKMPFDPSLRLHERMREKALQYGLCVYPTGGTIDGRRGDHVLLAPPFNVTADEIEMIVDRFAMAMAAMFESLYVSGVSELPELQVRR